MDFNARECQLKKRLQKVTLFAGIRDNVIQDCFVAEPPRNDAKNKKG